MNKIVVHVVALTQTTCSVWRYKCTSEDFYTLKLNTPLKENFVAIFSHVSMAILKFMYRGKNQLQL